MALIGGGGAGNVAGGANPSGTGSGINYIANHAYAYSGVVTSVGSTATLLDFTTGGEYIYVKTCLFALAEDAASGVDYRFEVLLNNEIISKQFLTSPQQGRQPADSDNLYLIIPPFTRFTARGASSSGDKDYTVTLVGRVYA
jgi:hypothetical protein